MRWRSPDRLMKRLSDRQKWEIRIARINQLTPEMEAVVVTGYSDFGRIGRRSAQGMKQMRSMLCRFHLLFSCITLLGLSDEAIFLYYNAFSAGLSPAHAINIVEGYRQRMKLLTGNTAKIVPPARDLMIREAISVALYDIGKRYEMLMKRGA